MSLLDNQGRLGKRRASLSRALMVDIYRGQERVRAWPKKRGKPKNPTTKEQNEWFRQAQWATKYWPAVFQADCARAVAGTPLLPRDLMTMIMANRVMSIADISGKVLYPMTAVIDVSESLDVIAQTPNSLLIRGANTWQGTTVAELLSNANALGLIPRPTLAPDRATPFNVQTIGLLFAYCDVQQTITGIRVPIRNSTINNYAYPLIYAVDANGLPTTLIDQGPRVMLPQTPTVVSMPFTTPQTVEAGSFYAIGMLVRGVGSNNMMVSDGNRPGQYQTWNTDVAPNPWGVNQQGASVNQGWFTY